jgi:flavodoxin
MADKSLIVFYSWLGNTAAVARELQAQTGFEIQEIIEKKERKKGNIPAVAFSAFLGLRSRIEPMDFNLDGYNQVFLGAQVWAGNMTPAINSYLNKTNFRGKRVFLFITKADKKIPERVIEKITTLINSKGGTVVDSISFTTKMDSVIIPEQFKDELHTWLVKNSFA